MKSILKKFVPKKLYARLKFPEVHKFINKGKLNKDSEKKSILVFTTRKCASTYQQIVLRYLNKHYLGMNALEFENYLYLVTTNSYQKIKDNYATKVPEKGCIWYPIRNYYDIPNIENYRVIVMTRDPRDVLVSNYFTVKENHGLPINKKRREDLLRRREEIQDVDINDYVLSRKKEIEIYQDFSEHLIGKDNVTHLRYEDMIQDFDEWINKLCSALEIELEKDHYDYLREKSAVDKKRGVDKIKAHIRQAKPKDFLRKLNDDTVKELNSRYADVLSNLGYIDDK